MQSLNEYEESLVRVGTKLYPGDVLFKASDDTWFVYAIDGRDLTAEELHNINRLNSIKEKFDMLKSLNINISFLKVENNMLSANLMLVDTQMALIVANMLENFYKGKADMISDLANFCCEDNVCRVKENDVDLYYKYKVKEFLTSIAIGMSASKRWHGDHDPMDSYIPVKENGDVLCYHIYNRNEFREYLFNNTKFDTPSKSKHHFGVIYDVDGEQFLKLNLQIRFLK